MIETDFGDGKGRYVTVFGGSGEIVVKHGSGGFGGGSVIGGGG